MEFESTDRFPGMNRARIFENEEGNTAKDGSRLMGVMDHPHQLFLTVFLFQIDQPVRSRSGLHGPDAQKGEFLLLITILVTYPSPGCYQWMMQFRRAFIHLPTSDVQKMVDFYSELGFSLIGTPGVREEKLAFARLGLNKFEIRIELWNLSEWETLRKGFSYTTFWIDVSSLGEIVDRLDAANIAYTGPHHEEYGSMELELFDPEGFRVICSAEQE